MCAAAGFSRRSSRVHCSLRTLLLLLLATLCPSPGLLAEEGKTGTIARCGAGFLEQIDGYLVLHVRGTPYEMGYQHGVLLKQHVKDNLNYLVNVKGAAPVKVGPLTLYPRAAISTIVEHQQKYIPPQFNDELAGLAEGSGVPLDEIRMGNYIPEMFHCSGFAVMNSATVDGELYHGRVLDYAVDWQLQQHAVLMVAEPKDGVPFVNVTYAGFIGSVTGMNADHVAIGEMGGGGLGHWDGVPMAVLVRQALERSHTLDDAVAVFRDSPRTCKYYYVISDGNTNRAVGMEASWDRFMTVEPGEAHELLPLAVKDSVLLSAGNRYKELARRAQEAHGKIDSSSALHLMDCPVAMSSNLHNALFAPRSTKFWVANASLDKQPAAKQKYFAFQLSELLKREPGDGLDKAR